MRYHFTLLEWLSSDRQEMSLRGLEVTATATVTPAGEGDGQGEGQVMSIFVWHCHRRVKEKAFIFRVAWDNKMLNAKPEDVRVQSPLSTLRRDLPLQGVNKNEFLLSKNKTTPKTRGKCWWGVGVRGNLGHWWWGYKLVQSLWKTVWGSSKN